jgi:hypothetical protein
MLARHVGREQEITDAQGRKWRLSRWTRGTWAALLEWARPRVPDRFALAKQALAAFPEHLHEGIAAHAVEAAAIPFGIGHPGVQAAVNGLEGTVHVVWLLLKPHHPDATEDDAFDLVMAIGFDEMERRLKKASGESPHEAGPEGNAPAPAG